MSPFSLVDAFVGTLSSSRELRGNPAAVLILDEKFAPNSFVDESARSAWMQGVASEVNLSETAFLQARAAPDEWDLRWFTPQCEVDLCGHATLAAAHVLWERGLESRAIRFHTRSGILAANRGENGEIELDFPVQSVQSAGAPPQLLHALGLKPFGDPVAAFRAADDWLLMIGAHRIEELQPDFAQLKQLTIATNARGVIVTAKSLVPEYDFVSRFFAPALGVDEDPVTGSAHTKLAPFWSGLLHKTEMIGLQASARGGLVRVKLDGNRVMLGGQARTRMRGEWLI